MLTQLRVWSCKQFLMKEKKYLCMWSIGISVHKNVVVFNHPQKISVKEINVYEEKHGSIFMIPHSSIIFLSNLRTCDLYNYLCHHYIVMAGRKTFFIKCQLMVCVLQIV